MLLGKSAAGGTCRRYRGHRFRRPACHDSRGGPARDAGGAAGRPPALRPGAGEAHRLAQRAVAGNPGAAAAGLCRASRDREADEQEAAHGSSHCQWLHPDLILDIGDVEPDYAALADKIQRETGIPYLLFDGRLAHTPEILRRLGPLLGEAAAGGRLADHAEGELKQIEAGLAALPPADRPGVYYARGGTGLQTGPAGSLLGEIVDMAGGRNLAPPTGSSAPAKTSLAEIARWDPDVVITQDAGLYRAMPSDPGWGALRAVQAHRLYLAPALPFGWIDEPPGINRLLGLRWLAARLHPQIFPWDGRAAVREFCELFYHAKPSDAALDRILASAP